MKLKDVVGLDQAAFAALYRKDLSNLALPILQQKTDLPLKGLAWEVKRHGKKKTYTVSQAILAGNPVTSIQIFSFSKRQRISIQESVAVSPWQIYVNRTGDVGKYAYDTLLNTDPHHLLEAKIRAVKVANRIHQSMRHRKPSGD